MTRRGSSMPSVRGAENGKSCTFACNFSRNNLHLTIVYTGKRTHCRQNIYQYPGSRFAGKPLDSLVRRPGIHEKSHHISDCFLRNMMAFCKDHVNASCGKSGFARSAALRIAFTLGIDEDGRFVFPGAAELRFIKLRIHAALSDQLTVGAAFNDCAVLHDKNLIGSQHG